MKIFIGILLIVVGLLANLRAQTNELLSARLLTATNLLGETAHYQRAVEYGYKADGNRALEEFSEVIRLNSNNVSAYEWRGVVQLRLSNYDAALSDFSDAIKLNPTNSTTYFNRAEVYRIKEDFNQAIQDMTLSIRLNPADDFAFKIRAACESEVQNRKSAIADWTEGLRLNPNDAWALAGRGGDYFAEGEFDKALADFYQALHLQPRNCLAGNWLAWLRATCPVDSMRNGKEAVEVATKICELTDWKDSSYLDTLAAAYAEVGDFAQAVKYEKQSLEHKTVSAKIQKECQHRLSLYEQNKPDHNGQNEYVRML